MKNSFLVILNESKVMMRLIKCTRTFVSQLVQVSLIPQSIKEGNIPDSLCCSWLMYANMIPGFVPTKLDLYLLDRGSVAVPHFYYRGSGSSSDPLKIHGS